METRKLYMYIYIYIYIFFFFLHFKVKGHTGLDRNGTVQIIRNDQILLTVFFFPPFGCTFSCDLSSLTRDQT